MRNVCVTCLKFFVYLLRELINATIMGVFFTVRTVKSSGKAPLQCRVQCTSPKVNLAVATPIESDIDLWAGEGKEGRRAKYYKTEEGKILRQKLESIEDGINFLLKQDVPVTKEQVREIINNVVYAEEIEEDNKKKEAEAAAEAEARRVTFAKFREMYLKQIKNGGRSTYTGKNFAPGTIVAISVSLNRLADFEKQKRHVYDFDEIDMTFYRDFTAFLKKRQYALNSIGKTVKVIKTVMRCAEEEGYHNNHSYMAHSFKAPKADADAIYLTKEDLDRINALDLSKECWGMQVARDIFMIGVWTAQRVSDYNNIRKEDVKTETIRSWDEDGNLSERQVRTIHVVQQKTGKKIVIPCNKALRDILDKYPDELPHISEQKLNLYLKELGRKAELNEMVDIRSTKGGELKVEPVAKHDLIHTHTARRTGATLMYLSGMNVYDICKITGHSNIKTLERYIKANELETVKKITEAYDYFK